MYWLTGNKKVKQPEREANMKGMNMRGLVPLFAGDLLLMWGTCQKYIQHKTLKFAEFASPDVYNQLLAEFPATIPRSRDLFLECALVTG